MKKLISFFNIRFSCRSKKYSLYKDILNLSTVIKTVGFLATLAAIFYPWCDYFWLDAKKFSDQYRWELQLNEEYKSVLSVDTSEKIYLGSDKKGYRLEILLIGKSEKPAKDIFLCLKPKNDRYSFPKNIIKSLDMDPVVPIDEPIVKDNYLRIDFLKQLRKDEKLWVKIEDLKSDIDSSESLVIGDLTWDGGTKRIFDDKPSRVKTYPVGWKILTNENEK